MDTQQLLSIVLKKAVTKTDALRRLRLLREYLEVKFYSDDGEITFSQFLKEKGINSEDSEILSSWNKSYYDWIDQDHLYDVINSVSEEIKKRDTITLYLPTDLDSEEKSKLGKWFLNNVSGENLLDIQKDKEILGGLAIVKKGVYNDYSLKHYFDKNRDLILDILNEYDKKKKTRTNTKKKAK